MTGPTKLPLKSVTGPCGDAGKFFVQAPTPLTIKYPPPAQVPPVQMPPLIRAPVEKLTEPKSYPWAGLIAPQLISSDPWDTTPPRAVMLTVPHWLVRSIPFAHAAAGNSSANRPTITATRLIIPSTGFQAFSRTTLGGGSPESRGLDY